MKRIGVLTGGGDAPGINAVLRAVVLAARGRGTEVLGIRDGFGGFLEADGTVELGEESVRGLLWRGGSILGCNNLYRGDSRRFVERMGGLGLDGLVVVGGDGTLAIASAMHEGGSAVVGVPKTIDNDVAGTDLTFGFDSAVSVVAEACGRLIDTGESHHRVMVVEVMGRHSGHLALHGALAGGADVALVPEIPYEPERVAEVVRERATRGRTYTLIVVAEGAVRRGGAPVVDARRTTATGSERLGGVGRRLTSELAGILGAEHEVRAIQLGHLQRGGPPTAFDRVLGTRLAVRATHALLDGERGIFSAWRRGEVTTAELSVAAQGARRLSPDDPLLAAARTVHIRFGD
ncbi:MAG: 6-phosphofructokinase [Planctomycetota bacterium]